MAHILVWKTLLPHGCSFLYCPGEWRGTVLLLSPAAEAARRAEQPALSIWHTPELAQCQPGCPGERVQRQWEPAPAVPGEVQPQVGQPLFHQQILRSCSFEPSDTGHLRPGFEKAPPSLEILWYLDSSSFSINLLIVLSEASVPSLSQMLALEGHFNIIVKINNDLYLLKRPHWVPKIGLV